MYNRLKLFGARPVFDKDLKVYLYPLTLSYIIDTFDEETLFLFPMNIIAMDEYDLKTQANEIMDRSRRTAKPIRNLTLTRYEIIMIYIMNGISSNKPELFVDMINGFLRIFEGIFKSEFDFNMKLFQFYSKEQITIEKITYEEDKMGKIVKKYVKDFLIINENNFEQICDSIKEVSGWNMGANENKPVYNPASEKAKRIAEKLEMSRKKIQAIKAKSSDEVTLTDLISAYCTQTKINPNEVVGTYTLFQFFLQSARESLFLEYNTSIQAMLHGASEVKLKNWSKKIN